MPLGKTSNMQFQKKDRLLDKQLDLVSKCRHEDKYILMNYSGID